MEIFINNPVINFLAENPMLLLAVVVFVLCVIIGFFGDMYIKKQNEIRKMKKEEQNQGKTLSTVAESNESLIASENINQIVTEQPLNAPVNNQVVEQQDGLGVETQNNDLMNNVPNNMSYEVSSEITPDIFPSENQLQEINGEPIVFDGQIERDDNINNIF